MGNFGQKTSGFPKYSAETCAFCRIFAHEKILKKTKNAIDIYEKHDIIWLYENAQGSESFSKKQKVRYIMKNRILSFVLALVMVLALVPVAAIGSSAEAEKTLDISLGHVTVAPGETVLLPLYAELSTDGGFQGISYWQLKFDYESSATLQSATTKFFVTAGSSYGTTNNTTKEAGITADSGALAHCAPMAEATAKGGALLALLSFTVDASVAEGTVLEVAPVDIVNFCLGSYSEAGAVTRGEVEAEGYAVNFIPGTITVATVGETAAPANEDEVDFYAVPEYVEGDKVTSIIKDQVQAGTYGTYYVPASITSVAARSVKGIVKNALIFKNTEAFDGHDKLVEMVYAGQDEDYDPAIYFHRLANGTDTMYDALVDLDTGADLINILGGGATVKEGALTVYGTIRVEDLAYEKVIVEAVIGDRVFESEFTCVYTTLTNGGKAVVSTNAGVVEAGAADGEGVYVFGLTITGVPAGEYDVVVNVYGLTASSTGSPVYVANDATTVKVTV